MVELRDLKKTQIRKLLLINTFSDLNIPLKDIDWMDDKR